MTDERILAADENILNSTRSTDFITPKSETSRLFRDAVLELASEHAFARPLVNSGRLSLPCIYDAMPLNGPDVSRLPKRSRPGAVAPDAPFGDGFLLDRLGGRFQLLSFGPKVETALDQVNIAEPQARMRERYLGDANRAIYLLRPGPACRGTLARP